MNGQKLMSLSAAIERALLPSMGCCYRCERPWIAPATKRIGPHSVEQLDHNKYWGHVGVHYHTTRYTDQSSCFPLCESCWAALTPTERLPYYEHLVDQWERNPRNEDMETVRAQIRTAVESGL